MRGGGATNGRQARVQEFWPTCESRAEDLAPAAGETKNKNYSSSSISNLDYHGHENNINSDIHDVGRRTNLIGLVVVAGPSRVVEGSELAVPSLRSQSDIIFMLSWALAWRPST